MSWNKSGWYPTSIENIKNNLIFKSKTVTKKNIAYNIQYLQYLDKLIKNEYITSAINRMRIKSFVITSMAIIETIFISLLRERNLIPLEEWKRGTHKHKEIDKNTVEVTYIKKKTKPTEKKINFDTAITLVEKSQVINLIPQTYPVIKILKDLRNRIHLDKATNLIQSDYLSFDEETYKITRLVLLYILKLDIVSKNYDYALFLKNN